jgi:hypothetical protein
MQMMKMSGLITVFVGAWLMCQLTACVGPIRQTTVFEQGDVRVGIESDLTTERTTPPSLNRHPYQITAEETQRLLRSIEVSGYGGVLLGVFQAPRPVPVFTSSELEIISGPIAQAFQQARANQRVFFSIPSNTSAYPNDREKTAGALLFRDGYLHVLLSDHYAFSSADPGGGEDRDPRDTKGMKLWAGRQGYQAVVPEQKEPRWGAFEKVHISLNPKEILASPHRDPSVGQGTEAVHPAMSGRAAAPSPAQAANDHIEAPTRSTSDELRLQIHELTHANLDLRSRLNEQDTEIDTLRQELDRLRQEAKPRSPQKSSDKTSPKPSRP